MPGYTDFQVPVKQMEFALQKIDSQGKTLLNIEVGGVIVEHLRPIGATLWFEYHCNESHSSSDAEVWYHSHQQAKVLSFAGCDPAFFATFIERGENGHVLLYRVRFVDGLEWDVFEDELLDSPEEFCRTDPPLKPCK